MMEVRAIDPWAREPLEKFLKESGARLCLLTNPSGQVIAQYGFSRAVDVMAAAALGAGIISSSKEMAGMLAEEEAFDALNHQGKKHGIFLAEFASPQGRLVVLIVYGRESSPGLVQLFFEEFVADIGESCPPREPRPPVIASDFEKDLNENLRTLFGGGV
ncbi:MAG: roadblock/LC7 domain-containing protein [Gemmatimonadales bacterium]